MPFARHFVTRLAALAAASAATLVFAPAAFALGSLVDVQVVDRGQSEVLPVYSYRGASWIAGAPGSRYAVRLSNRTGGRVLVVLSVDGINAVSGQTAAVGQTGYVLGPYQSTEITGWRKSLTEAAAFYFTSLQGSYAARTDRPNNVGVVGAAIFREKSHESARRPAELNEPLLGAQDSDHKSGAAESTAMPAPPAAPLAARRGEPLGTGHGEREYSPTTNVAFERASDGPAELVQVRYDSYQNLVALGVVGGTNAQKPEAFPLSPSTFVPDPTS
jgi:hypothetical protein